MFNNRNNEPYVATGTTAPIYIPRQGEAKIVRPGESYFFVKIRDAQAAFYGRIWEWARRLIVTSQVSLNHPKLGHQSMRAIQRSRKVRSGQAVRLGLSPNLINLVPAVMDHVSISIEFILDTENHLSKLAGLINDDAFVAAVSLAPTAAMAARTIGSISQQIIQSFLKPEQRQPILQFSGDFNIAADGLREGYYVILGTRDARHPLPEPLPKLAVRGGNLLADGKRVSQLSYVILEVRGLEARTRALNEGAVWEEKLRQAEGIAQRLAADPFGEEAQKKQAWQECKKLLKEAQSLLLADANYLQREAQDIIAAAYAYCLQQIFEEHSPLRIRSDAESNKGSVDMTRNRTQVAAPSLEAEQIDDAPPDSEAARAWLGISPDEELAATLERYAEQVAQTRRILAQQEID